MFSSNNIPVGGPPLVAITADFNGDGKLDVAVGNWTNSIASISILLGNGDGTFQSPAIYSLTGQPSSIAVGDFNGDGKLDLAVPSDGGPAIFLGNGDGTFQSATYSGAHVGIIVAGDFNGDGKLDLAGSFSCAGPECGNPGQIAILLGNGDGTFQPQINTVVDSSGSSFPDNFAIGDFNGDGKLDLAVVTHGDCLHCSGALYVLLGNGDGTFQPPVLYGAAPNANGSTVVTADFNGDGKLDLAIGADNGATTLTSNIFILLGVGDGTFQSGATYDFTSGDVIATADLNADGHLDLAMGRVGVLLGDGDGTFSAPISLQTGFSVSLVAGDFNGDGLMDLLGSDYNTSSAVLFLQVPATATTLSSSLNPSHFGQPVTFTATVSSPRSSLKPTGTVSFFDNATSTNLGTFTLNSGVAVVQTSALGPSTHSIVATYSGAANFLSSDSPALSQVVLGAAMKLSPTSLAFGNQTVDMPSSPQTITLKNTGDIALTFNSITFTGTNPTNFTQSNTCGSSLAGGATCTFSVTFNPTAAGSRSAALTLSDNAPSKLQKVPVSGVGVLPAVTFSPTSLTFPTQLIYTTSKAQTVTLTNSGLGILNISNISVSAQFSQANNCRSTVAPSGTCTLMVKFQPTALDTITGTISIADNASASPQALPLTGVATAIQLTPVGVSFGNQPVGTKSLAKTVTVSNKSHQTINISRIAIRGADPSDFPFVSTTCGASLSSGSSCFIRVAFKPTVTGKRTATVVVSEDGGGEVQRVGLAGTGT